MLKVLTNFISNLYNWEIQQILFFCPSPSNYRLLIIMSVCFLNRNDELGIPFSVVIDEDTIDMASIGVRHRDSTLKVRENIIQLID